MSGTNKGNSTEGLQLNHIFGFNADVMDNMHFIDETTVVYPAGHTIVILNTETQKQNFVFGSNHGASLPENGITAIDLSPNKRFVAVAERGERAALVIVHEINAEKRRKKKLTTSEQQSREIVRVQFSPDGKFLLTLGGAPDWCLINWHWEKSRIVQIAQAVSTPSSPLYTASYCPAEPNLICVSGHKTIKFFKIEQNDFKLLQCNLGKREPQDYLCHCWANGWDSDRRLLVGTDTAEILIFEGNEFKGVFEHPHASPVHSIMTYSKGFVMGCEGGCLIVFEKSDEKDLYKEVNKQIYKEVNKLSVHEHLVSVTNLAISPSEETLVLALENHQAYTLNLSQVEVMKDDSQESNFHPLTTPSHFRAVTGLDHCIRKPLIVTCGIDRSVRVWNWHDKNLVISKTFKQDPLCVTMHPSGLNILVGFSDRVRLMNLLMDDIRTFKEFTMKGCREARFSNGGQYFAAVNGSTIQIYNTYTCANILNLRAHTAKVLSVHWSLDDSSLVSASMDSSVLEWDLRGATRTQEHQHKGCSYTSAINTSDGTIYCVGSDSSLKVVLQSVLKKIIELPVILTNLATTRPPEKLLIAGTKAGFIKAFTLPLRTKGNRLGYHEYQCHTKMVTRLCISHDDSMIFTCSEDGTVGVWNTRQISSKKKELQQLGWAEEILVTKSDLQNRMKQMEKLKKKVEDLRLHNEYEIRMKEMNYQEKLREVNEKFKQELEQDRQKYQTLKDERDGLKRKYENTLKTLAEKHQDNLLELEAYHEQKILAEQKRYEDLQKKLEDARSRWSSEDKQRARQYHQEIRELEQEYERKIQLEEELTTQLTQAEAEIKKEFGETKILIEDDADREITQLKTEYDEILKAERVQTLELRGNNGMLKREFAGLQQKIKNGNDKMQKSVDIQKKLVDEIKRLEKDIEGYEREIDERDFTIKEKDKLICELRKKNQELAKFKFVLDYKIHELDRQIKPREQTIKEIAEQIEEMKDEVSQYKRENLNLSLSVKDLKLKLAGLEKEECAMGGRVQEAQGKQRMYQADLESLQASKVIHSKALKKVIFDLFVTSTHKKDATGGRDSLSEYQRHRSYLERSIQSLERKMEKDAQLHKKDLLRLYRENVTCLLDAAAE